MRYLFMMAVCCLCGLSTHATAAEYVLSAEIDHANVLYPIGTLVNGRFGSEAAIGAFQIEPIDTRFVGIYADPAIFLKTVMGGVAYTASAFGAVFDTVGSKGDALALTGFGPDVTLHVGLLDPTAKTFAGVTLPNSAFRTHTPGPLPGADDHDAVAVLLASLGFTDTTTDRFFDTAILVLDAVPEPATWMMLIVGIGMIGAAMRRRDRGTSMVVPSGLSVRPFVILPQYISRQIQ